MGSRVFINGALGSLAPKRVTRIGDLHLIRCSDVRIDLVYFELSVQGSSVCDIVPWPGHEVELTFGPEMARFCFDLRVLKELFADVSVRAVKEATEAALDPFFDDFSASELEDFKNQINAERELMRANGKKIRTLAELDTLGFPKANHADRYYELRSNGATLIECRALPDGQITVQFRPAIWEYRIDLPVLETALGNIERKATQTT